ncbi:response regulator [Desertivirga xinjiangensis]|uniref:response regulator n=1 Tax=Desertivirga xinjiangensis TaxID=539206 RepID=UPI00210C874A
MRKRVLVFEQDRDILEVVSYVLIEEGYDVAGFSSEKEVLENLGKEDPDLILLDVQHITPEGTALCEKIRKDQQFGHIPIVVLSTHMKASKVKEVCADDVVGKPFDIDMLLEVIGAHIDA